MVATSRVNGSGITKSFFFFFFGFLTCKARCTVSVSAGSLQFRAHSLNASSGQHGQGISPSTQIPANPSCCQVFARELGPSPTLASRMELLPLTLVPTVVRAWSVSRLEIITTSRAYAECTVSPYRRHNGSAQASEQGLGSDSGRGYQDSSIGKRNSY